MPRLRIRHESLYAYSTPVEFGVWRLLMRPLDSHAIRVLDASLETPPGQLTWTFDAYGNSVCYLQPLGAADHLRVVNNLLIERFPTPLGVVGWSTPTLPVLYGVAARRALESFIAPDTPDLDAAYADWLRLSGPRADEPALAFLQRMTTNIHDTFAYVARDAPGVQGPAETIAHRSGTCRDFAWLMIESVRHLGFAARFATGYLHAPGAAMRGACATHAWCEVFLPEAGWMEFDPTNALVESYSLIRVASARTWQEASPMVGSVFGQATSQLHVSVDVELMDEAFPARAA